MTMTRYNVSLNPKMESDLTKTARTLELKKSEVMRRALELYHHVIDSDSNTVDITRNGRAVSLIVR